LVQEHFMGTWSAAGTTGFKASVKVCCRDEAGEI
jgi:hypothetical protein